MLHGSVEVSKVCYPSRSASKAHLKSSARYFESRGLFLSRPAVSMYKSPRNNLTCLTSIVISFPLNPLSY